MSEGWRCPGCGTCYSPFVQACWNCRLPTFMKNHALIPCPGCGKIPCDHSGTGCPFPPRPWTISANLAGGETVTDQEPPK